MDLDKIAGKRILDFTYSHVISSDIVRGLVKKQIGRLEMHELSFLLRERQFTEVIIDIAIELLQRDEIQINVFHHSSDSARQRELIRELILVDKEFWDLNPFALEKFKQRIKEYLPIVRLPNYIKEFFQDYKPNQLIWTEENVIRYDELIKQNAAGTVLSAFNEVRKLARSIIIGNNIDFCINSIETKITNIDDFNKLIVDNLSNSVDLYEQINSEKKL
jgi:hypothetical protein